MIVQSLLFKLTSIQLCRLEHVQGVQIYHTLTKLSVY